MANQKRKNLTKAEWDAVANKMKLAQLLLDSVDDSMLATLGPSQMPRLVSAMRKLKEAKSQLEDVMFSQLGDGGNVHMFYGSSLSIAEHQELQQLLGRSDEVWLLSTLRGK